MLDLVDLCQAWNLPPVLSTWEIIRTFHYAFNLDGILCSAFLNAYRLILPLLVEELEIVAAVYGWMRVHDLWYYKTVYLEDNQRVRTSFQAGPFIPFEKQWADLRRFLRDS
jgi:hypothetical protein